MLALIDGDILVYRAAFAAERNRYKAFRLTEAGVPESTPFWDDYGYREMMAFIKNEGIEEFTTIKEHEVDDEGIAVHNVDEMMSRLQAGVKEKFGDDAEFYTALSKGDESHRFYRYEKYKHRRKDMPKPVHYAAVRNRLIKKYDAKEFRSVEADDVLAYLQITGAGVIDTVICSVDKDLLQVEGHHYNIVTGETQFVHGPEADFNLYCQVLTGDYTDDIPGIHGLGPAKASKLLRDCSGTDEMKEICRREWKKYSETDRYKKDFPEIHADNAYLLVRGLVTVGDEEAWFALNESQETKQLPEWARG